MENRLINRVRLVQSSCRRFLALLKCKLATKGHRRTIKIFPLFGKKKRYTVGYFINFSGKVWVYYLTHIEIYLILKITAELLRGAKFIFCNAVFLL